MSSGSNTIVRVNLGASAVDWHQSQFEHATFVLFTPLDTQIAAPAEAALLDVFRGNPHAIYVSCDNEFTRNGDLDIQTFTAPDLLSWSSGGQLPGCFAVRRGDNGVTNSDLQEIQRDARSWCLSAMARWPEENFVHAPLPLCRTPQSGWSELDAYSERAQGLFNREIEPNVLANTLSVVIPTRDGGNILRACIESIKPALVAAPQRVEVVVVDNASDDLGTLQYLRQLETDHSISIRVLRYDKPFNYAAINNWAVNQCSGQFLLLLNDDIEACDDVWLDQMFGALRQPGVGVVGAQLLYPDGRVQHAGVALGLGGVAEHPGKGLFPDDERFSRLGRGRQRRVSAVTGACLLTERNLYLANGGLNEKNLAVAFNDVDYCLKVQRSGKKTVIAVDACLLHHESISRGAENTLQKQQRFAGEVAYMKKKWAQQIDSDPFYSPHLSRHASDLSFRNPPSPSLSYLSVVPHFQSHGV
ncbi:MAG: glycosyltransferase family 2 protein [Oceanococcus sp.]